MLTQFRFSLVSVAGESVLNFRFSGVAIGTEFVFHSVLKFGLNLGVQGSRDVIDGFAECEVVLCLEASLSLSKAPRLLFVKLLLDLATQLIPSLGDGEFNVLSHTLFEVVGFSAKLLFNVGL